MSSNIIIFLFATSTAFISWYMTPTHYIADELGSLNLEEVVPSKIGDWRALPKGSGYLINPQQQMIDMLYSEVLERTYTNNEGYRIMLSIAYGRDQSDDFALHEPKVCYPSQGFVIKQQATHELLLNDQMIIASRMVATLDKRVEPITYWTLVGDQIFVGGLDKKIKQMKYGFNGYIPDGILVRISSVDEDSFRAYTMHDLFANNLIESLPEEIRVRFIGLKND